GKGVRGQAVDAHERDVGAGGGGVAVKGREGVPQPTVRRSAHGSHAPELARSRLAHETEPLNPPRILQRKIQREKPGEGRHGYVGVGLRPRVDEVAGHEAAYEGDGKTGAGPAP